MKTHFTCNLSSNGKWRFAVTMLLIHHVKQQPEIDPILSPTAAPTPPWPGEAFPNPAVVEFFFFFLSLCCCIAQSWGRYLFPFIPYLLSFASIHFCRLQLKALTYT